MSVETVDCANSSCESEIFELSFDLCNPSLKYNEIRKLYLGNDGFPLTNWTDPAEWATRISNVATASNAIREATVVGTLDVEQGERVRIAGGRFVSQPSNYTLGALIYDNNDINYTFIRSMGCNRAYRVWYETSDGDLYGGNEGILVVVNGTEPITDDPETFRTLNINGEWQSQLPPLRIPSPIAA